MTRGRLPGGGGSSVVGKRETRLYEPEERLHSSSRGVKTGAFCSASKNATRVSPPRSALIFSNCFFLRTKKICARITDAKNKKDLGHVMGLEVLFLHLPDQIHPHWDCSLMVDQA
ncbi:hypothetical protein IFM89_036477 [Coptis chinensis]|uniref:Uncharacterized protein n=1 Tax=Coptis chinensis TaxID=261450 RepID=A0A835J083_9MAGN|nr:hypothetical protein IFM89_036477 [Coptis chinensis]